jgi:exonuclease-1
MILTLYLIWFCIQVLQKNNVDYIVSPYEADAQLAYLSSSGLVDLVISEDSDLLPYGAKQVIYYYH